MATAEVRSASLVEEDTLRFSVLNVDELKKHMHHYGIDIKKVDALPVEIAGLLASHFKRSEELLETRLSAIEARISDTVSNLGTQIEHMVKVSGVLNDAVSGKLDAIQAELVIIKAKLAEFE